jgi:hypothetical protein
MQSVKLVFLFSFSMYVLIFVIPAVEELQAQDQQTAVAKIHGLHDESAAKLLAAPSNIVLVSQVTFNFNAVYPCFRHENMIKRRPDFNFEKKSKVM